MQEWIGKHVLVLGLGVSGRSAARFCAERGAIVTAADDRGRDALAALNELPDAVDLQLGGSWPDPAEFDLVVPSPGVPPARYAERARRVWGEIELAYRALTAPIVAVTGTNGKSTTTVLIEAMLQAAGLRAQAAGNLGAPALDLVGLPLDVAVLEISSFQLEAIEAFQPRVAVVLNIEADHLDRHGDLDGYAAAKARIIENQQADDTMVLNAADARVNAFSGHGRALRFLSDAVAASGEVDAWLDAGAVVVRHGEELVRIPWGRNGRHTIHPDNVMSALLAVSALGVDPGKASLALRSFEPLPHRMQTVAEIDGVTFVNDSKATNPSAAAQALASCPNGVIWIAGGRDKGLHYDRLANVARDRVREAILYGESAGKLAEALARNVPFTRAEDLEDAVLRAHKLARRGEVVLLSPACSSLDQFRDFEERGDRFVDVVHDLEASQS